MAKFIINIQETLEDQVEVEAETVEEAICKVQDMYDSGEIVLTFINHTATEIYEL